MRQIRGRSLPAKEWARLSEGSQSGKPAHEPTPETVTDKFFSRRRKLLRLTCKTSGIRRKPDKQRQAARSDVFDYQFRNLFLQSRKKPGMLRRDAVKPAAVRNDQARKWKCCRASYNSVAAQSKLRLAELYLAQPSPKGPDATAAVSRRLGQKRGTAPLGRWWGRPHPPGSNMLKGWRAIN